MGERGYRSILGALFSVMLYYGSGFIFSGNGGTVFALLIGAAGTAAFFWVSGFGKRMYEAACLCLVGAAFGLSLFRGLWSGWLIRTTTEGEALLEYCGKPGMRLLFEGLMILAITALGYLLAGILQEFWRLQQILAAGLLTAVVASVFQSFSLPRHVFACVCCYAVMVACEWYERVWRKQKQSGERAYMTWLTPFFLLYILMVMFAPYRETPYDWNSAKRLWQNVTEGVDYLVGGLFEGEGDFLLPASGFSERGGLFAGVRSDERIMLRIETGMTIPEKLYLGGKSFDTFNGREWTKTDESSAMDTTLDALELLYGVNRFDGEHQRDYIRINSVQVFFDKQKSKSLFLPGKVYQVHNSDSLPIHEAGGDIELERRKGYGFSYQSTFFRLNRGSEMFDRLLRENTWEEEPELWQKVQKELRVGQAFSIEDLRERQGRIAEVYGQAPELSERAMNWLTDVCGSRGNGYDRLKALEEALAGLTYTTRPGEMPKEICTPSDYLDYILFEKPEGYCAYFATAFTLMARSLGYPARYVQGYCVSGNSSEVRSGEAHAWPEVYFEGAGWIPFEPTPGYYETSYAPWKSMEDIAKEREEALKQQGQNDPGTTEEHREEQRTDPETPAETTETEDEAGAGPERLWQVAVILMILATVGLSLLMIELLREKRRRSRRDLALEYRETVGECFALLEQVHLGHKENETMREYGERLKQTKIPEKAFAFLERYEAAVYGSSVPTVEMLEQVKIGRQALYAVLEEEKGSLARFYKIKLYLYHKNS